MSLDNIVIYLVCTASKVMYFINDSVFYLLMSDAATKNRGPFQTSQQLYTCRRKKFVSFSFVHLRMLCHIQQLSIFSTSPKQMQFGGNYSAL